MRVADLDVQVLGPEDHLVVVSKSLLSDREVAKLKEQIAGGVLADRVVVLEGFEAVVVVRGSGVL